MNNSFDHLDKEKKAKMVELLREKRKREEENKLNSFFPDDGPHKRELYPKHLEFFKAGAEHRERAFMAANRVGKTVAGSYELTLHLTGLYPDWWEGKRFNGPIKAWCAGKTNETARDILQRTLIGPKNDQGTGMIPKALIERTTARPGIPDALQDAYIMHKSGKLSELTFKSYVQGIDSFMGTERHVIWLDEEPDPKIYSECLTRTMTVNGIVLCTFTPLKGLSEVVLSFMPEGKV